MDAFLSMRVQFRLVSTVALITSASLFNSRALGQVAGPRVAQTSAAKPAWLEGTGKDLRIKLAGQVFDETGRAANGCKLTAALTTRFGVTNLPVVMERNSFQVWVPVGDAGPFHVHLKAASAVSSSPVSPLTLPSPPEAGGQGSARDALRPSATGGEGSRARIGWETVSAFQLRQAAVDGLKLTIKPPGRFLDVTVVENGRPVPDACVVANVEGMPVTGRTNGMGIARFPLQEHDQLSQLTAWTDNFRIGGYSFSRDPPRDPSGSKFTIELEKCRPQIIRIINDESKTSRSPLTPTLSRKERELGAVPDLPFFLTVRTGPPNYQYPGQTPGCEMRTNDKGEAVYRWFPDWKTHGSYVEIRDPRWIKAAAEQTVDGSIVVRVKKSRSDTRKRVVGRVVSTRGEPQGRFSTTPSSVAALAVEMRSFQDEEEHRSEVLSAFTDANGAFAAEYLPDSTYCIYVNDARYVSNIIDLIPYDAATSKTNAPSLTVSEGQPVEISVTQGPAKAPVAHQSVQLETPHEYSWREHGKPRQGQGGRRWWVTTNEQGKARTFALPGEKIEGFLYTPEWRSKLSAEVKTDGITRLEFHRDVADARKIRGRLLLTGDAVADLNEAGVEIGSVDGETQERLTVKTNARGEFSFASKASRIGIYARTKDSRAAGIAVLERFDRPLEIYLKPTGEFRGQLLGKENRPLQGHAVRAAIQVSGKGDYSPPSWPTSFLAASFEARTDGEGNYSFSGLPCEVAISLSADPVDGSGARLDSFYLVAHESRPRIVSRLWRPQRKMSFTERYERVLRDCRLSNFGAMVILYRPAEDMKEFVEANFMGYGTTREVMAFIQLQGSLGDESGPEIAAFARSKDWPLPGDGKVFALAMDPSGRELGRIEIDAKNPEGPALASDFIRKHAPVPADAREKWDEAFALARQTGRKVWVRISQRYCAPCFMLTRWLDEQKKLLAGDYVFLKIDDVRDLHGAEVAKRLTGWELQGIPFSAIFDSDGTMLITSESPLGNFGYPSSFDDKKHLRKMLVSTRKNLTDQEIEQIVNSLGD